MSASFIPVYESDSDDDIQETQTESQKKRQKKRNRNWLQEKVFKTKEEAIEALNNEGLWSYHYLPLSAYLYQDLE